MTSEATLPVKIRDVYYDVPPAVQVHIAALEEKVKDLQPQQEPVAFDMPEYDAGLLPTGDWPDSWWQDYLRSELGRAYDFYIQYVQENYTSPPLPRLSEKQKDYYLLSDESAKQLVQCYTRKGLVAFIQKHFPDLLKTTQLSDEDIGLIIDDHIYFGMGYEDLRKFARAIEAKLRGGME